MCQQDTHPLTPPGYRQYGRLQQSSLFLNPVKTPHIEIFLRPISLLCPAAKVLESLILPSVNMHLLPAQDQYYVKLGHWTSSAPQQLATDIEMSYHQKRNSDRTSFVEVDLSAEFNTVCHTILKSKVSCSNPPTAICG